MLSRTKYLLPVLATLLLYSCGNGNSEEKVADWYESTRDEILAQCDETPDSTATGINEIWSFYKGRVIKYETVNAGKPRYTVMIAEDTNFRLVREYCPHGKLSYEGVEYQRMPYGTATWYDCETGKITVQGNRFKFRKIGVWKEYNPDGSVKSEFHYKGKLKPKKLPALDQ